MSHPFPATPPTGDCHHLYALALQLSHLAMRPAQQSPEQWDALASRLAALARAAWPAALRVGVGLERLAANARGRAVRRPFVGLDDVALTSLALKLSDLALEWHAAPPAAIPSVPPAVPALPEGVVDFAARAARRRSVPSTTVHDGGAA